MQSRSGHNAPTPTYPLPRTHSHARTPTHPLPRTHSHVPTPSAHSLTHASTHWMWPQVKDQLELMFDAERDEIISLSAKTGEGVDKLLPALVRQIPSPARACASYEDGKVRALLFDSWYEDYRGVVCLLQVRCRTRALVQSTRSQPHACFHSRCAFVQGLVGSHHHRRQTVHAKRGDTGACTRGGG